MTTIRALIYCRVSQDRREGRSVGQQETECRQECAGEGWDVVDVVTDNDVGASRFSKGRRPGWARVLALVEAGEVDVLVTWEGSRAQRDLGSYAALRELCIASHVRWRYGGRTYDMTRWQDRRDTGRDAVDDEAESGRTSERIRRDVRAAAVAGRPHGRRLFGYQRNYDPATGALTGQEPHPDEAPIVQQIFRRYAAGAGYRRVAEWLNGEGFTTNTGCRWNDAQVRRVLTNPGYAGRRVHQGEVIGDAVWPALVDDDLYERVQARIEGRRHVRSARTARLLTGVARCGVCGARLAVGKAPDGRRYYQCRGDRGMGARFCVSRDLVALDAWVTVIVLERLAQPDVAEALAGVDDPAVAAAVARVDELQARLDDAVAEYTAGHLTAATLARIEADLQPQITDATRDARRARLPLDIDMPTSSLDAWWDSLDPALRREVVAALVASVTVHRVGKGRRTFDPTAVTVDWRR